MSKRIKQIVLLGLGHTHAHVVKEWAKNPIPGCQLIAISDHWQATYSGMLPGVLAGDYRPEQMQIDLFRLCKAAGVRLVEDQLEAIDRDLQVLTFKSGRQLSYSLLSVAVGSRPPTLPGVQPAGEDESWFVPIKPMQTLLPRINSGISAAIENCKRDGRMQVQIDVVGGGLGSLEIAMCLPGWLKSNGLRENDFKLRVISGSDNPPEGCLQSTRNKIQSILKKRNISLLTGAYLDRVQDRQLILRNGVSLDSDLVIYVGAGVASEVTANLNVQLDRRRCIVTNEYLQSVEDRNIWAAGDCGSIEGKDVPKAGVYAVRQGPVIWQNLKRWSEGAKLEAFRPQHDFLKLINTGDGSAIGQWKGFSFSGAWVWRWKDRIDRNFLAMYQEMADARMSSSSGMSAGGMSNSKDTDMRCLGCGGKVGGRLLRETLAEIIRRQEDKKSSSASEFKVLDPDSLNDDVAVWTNNSHDGNPGITAVSVDTMADPIGDPFVFGRIAILHALSDLWASGVCPRRITLSVELPIDKADPRSTLVEVMTGVVETLREHNVQLVGGHTMEGPRLTLSITAIGQADAQAIPLPKQGLQVGDRLIYTKSLGIGIALAAAMRNECSAETFQQTLRQMQIPNEVALKLTQQFSVHAATDVTGFGLVGHLHEMVADSGLSIGLDRAEILRNLLPGVAELIDAGIESTLAPSNREYLPLDRLQHEVAVAGIVDPQTSGGLLFAVPESSTAECLSFLSNQGNNGAWVVGRVQEAIKGMPWLSWEEGQSDTQQYDEIVKPVDSDADIAESELDHNDAWDPELDLP